MSSALLLHSGCRSSVPALSPMSEDWRDVAFQLMNSAAAYWAEVSLDEKLERETQVARAALLDKAPFDFSCDSEVEDPRYGVLAPLVKMLRERLKKAFPGLLIKMVATKRAWAEEPVFHVDTAAFTVILPVDNAPTMLKPVVAPKWSDSGPEGLPLMMGTRSVVGDAASSDPAHFWSASDKILILKGIGWRRDHLAAVHSPPAVVVGDQVATAIIAELVLPSSTASQMM